MARKLRIAILGTGGIAGAHLRGYRNISEAEIVAACDVRADAVKKAAEEYQIPRTETDYRRVLAMKDVDAVDICTPNAYHMPMTVAALRAGKHVLCEKPLAITTAEVKKMIAARDKSRKMLMCAQHQRFVAPSLALKALLGGGTLGEVYFARAWANRRRQVPGWGNFIQKKVAGGGPCIDIGVHILDLTMHLMENFKPVSVTGVTCDKLGRNPKLMNQWGEYDRKKFDVEDFAAGFVRFANGAALSLECSFMLNEKDPTMRCSVFGTKAGAMWPEMEIIGESNRVLTDTKIAYTPKNAPPGHEQECRVFAQAVLGGDKSPVPAEQSLAVVSILESLYKSAATGKEVKVAM
ncbi:MAG: Myo-inositol 2-dehydrogenase [Phycisphaerae bacterium]|nr:Myo-inositol 2-dehydrogenase [Phycisphaerae bacterium]